MELERIKAAVKAGLTVHWANAGYIVQVDKYDQWFITWDKGGRRENSVGLSWGAAIGCSDRGEYDRRRQVEGTLIEDEKAFYVGWQCLSYSVDDACHAEVVTREFKDNTRPARYVAFQAGFERLWVVVFSYMDGILVDADDAEELARDYLLEIKWFADPTQTDAVQVI